MKRTAINPVTWSQAFGFNQGELVAGNSRTLYISGQTATGPDGSPQHMESIADQLTLALDNVEAVLADAGFSLGNLVRLSVYTTDIETLFEHYGILASRLGAAGAAPATTMLEVRRFAIAGELVELEGTAVGD